MRRVSIVTFVLVVIGPGLRAEAPRDLIAVSADLTRTEPATAMVKEVEARFGAIDILVNSAGAAKRYLPEDLNAAAWHAAMDAKYFSTIHAIDAVLPGMVARGRAS